MTIKLLFGGSPCTYWSIAKTSGRETTAEGQGWELFKNYLIAKEKFKPDFFLYENNWSASKAIKDQIQEELGCELMRINSALVSAQKRDRFYVFNWGVEQPEDRGILLKDILETGQGYNPYHEDLTGKEKAYCLTARYNGACPWNTIERKQKTMIAEPVCLRMVRTEEGKKLRKAYESHEIKHRYNEYRRPEPRPDGKTNTLTTVLKDNPIMIPMRIGTYPNSEGEIKNSQGNRIYDVAGKSITLSANGGGRGAKTGLYAEPVNTAADGKARCVRATCYKDGIRNLVANDVDKRTCVAIPCRMVGRRKDDNGKRCDFNENIPLQQQIEVNKDRNKTNCLTTVQKDNVIAIPREKDNGNTIYKVENGQIEIKGKKYPIKLKDGKYIIRKLTPVECERLQTMPDGYTDCVSNTQRYKGLGNGWTAEVIIHILQGALKDVPKDEKIIVLSMYDGIGTGRYCLDKMGFTNVEYHAFEIDKFAKKVANNNYPDIIQHGDAFQIREWGDDGI